jgi:hypothetical protein
MVEKNEQFLHWTCYLYGFSEQSVSVNYSVNSCNNPAPWRVVTVIDTLVFSLELRAES